MTLALGDGILYTSALAWMLAEPYWKASTSNLASWTRAGNAMSSGGSLIRFDPDHGILYSTNGSDGFYRLVTR